MRVLYFSRGYTSHDHRFLAALGETGHEVFYLRLEPGRPGEESRPVPPKVRVVGWPGGERPWRWTGVARRRAVLRRVLDEVQADLVHAGPVQRGALLTALAGFRPLVTMSWGSDLLLEARGGLGRWAARYTLARSAALICDCQTVRRAAQELGMPEERIVVSPWGVDLRHFSQGDDGGLRSRLGWESSFVILSTRSWEPIYGVEVLVEAFIRAARVEPSLRLLALSGGSLRPEIEGILSRAALADRVRFLGQVAYDELPACYRAADVYVSASRCDGTSVSLLEAMASGLPAIVSDIPANREWVEPGVNGWWFRDGDAAALAESILTASRAGKGLKEMGKRSRETAEARADWERNFPTLLRAYEIARTMGKER